MHESHDEKVFRAFAISLPMSRGQIRAGIVGDVLDCLCFKLALFLAVLSRMCCTQTRSICSRLLNLLHFHGKRRRESMRVSTMDAVKRDKEGE